MRLLICWIEMTGYLAACCRELARQPGMQLRVLATRPGQLMPHAPFDAGLARGFDCVLLDGKTHSDAERIAELAGEFAPDVIYLSGWGNPAYVRIAFDTKFRATPFILGMDTPRRNTWRQRFARIKIGRFLDRMACVMVPGERGWQLARHELGVSEQKLRRGLYGFDYEAFAPVLEQRLRLTDGWPRRFLFVGRYQPVKGLDLLLEAYAQYRKRVSNPWPLTCCGQGPLTEALAKAAGVEDLGFVQPEQQPEVMARAGVFVLPSRDEPWGVAVAEHAAGGLPLVCSEAVGSAVELLRPLYNGLSVPSDNMPALTAALHWMHEHHAELPKMGRRSQELARPFSADIWARRWAAMCRELTTCGS